MTSPTDKRFLTFSRNNFKVSMKIAEKVTKNLGFVIQVHDNYHEGIYYSTAKTIGDYDFAYVKGYLHALEQIMVDMFQ